jgi:hypothetical protein
VRVGVQTTALELVLALEQQALVQAVSRLHGRVMEPSNC